MTRSIASHDDWKPRSAEDRLLKQYISSKKGAVYLEVPIGGPGGVGKWPPGCTTRRLDAVRLYGRSVPVGVYQFRSNKEAFLQQIHRLRVELVEVKTGLDRYVIGQAIAGRHMFRRHYKVKPARVVILCRYGDTALEWVCKRENIFVEQLRG